MKRLDLAVTTSPVDRRILEPMSLRIDAFARAFGHACESVLCMHLLLMIEIERARRTFVYNTGQCCLTLDER